ncbi:unnamed protein product [Lepeophtheirus salmonis]|uniref:(salmon louse) hypothetical protein n=1 Tax=Lepeophtheirus salmonis TaxID=72036 RepID=A0A7R8D0E7_LEPSM|nr:unnamed protein product [Lepeophtheirus salmonis]CAF2958345.1 unnamed protein product [Lepeophtheirus salmonis]
MIIQLFLADEASKSGHTYTDTTVTVPIGGPRIRHNLKWLNPEGHSLGPYASLMVEYVERTEGVTPLHCAGPEVQQWKKSLIEEEKENEDCYTALVMTVTDSFSSQYWGTIEAKFRSCLDLDIVRLNNSAPLCRTVKWKHSKIDVLNRGPLEKNLFVIMQQIVRIWNLLVSSGIDEHELIKQTSSDKMLSLVLPAAKSGTWMDVVDEAFLRKRNALSVPNNLLFWDVRLVVSLILKSSFLQEIHVNHSGVVRMKAIARSRLW